MKIAGTQFTVSNGTFEIYFSGCKPPHCEGCHNPELIAFHEGRPWRDVWELLAYKLYRSAHLIKNIHVVGGEPLDQNHEEFVEFTTMLCAYARALGIKTWLFTKYELEDVPTYHKMQYDFIKTGRYQKDSTPRKSRGITLASKNQKINVRGIHYFESSIPPTESKRSGH